MKRILNILAFVALGLFVVYAGVTILWQHPWLLAFVGVVALITFTEPL